MKGCMFKNATNHAWQTLICVTIFDHIYKQNNTHEVCRLNRFYTLLQIELNLDVLLHIPVTLLFMIISQTCRPGGNVAAYSTWQSYELAPSPKSLIIMNSIKKNNQLPSKRPWSSVLKEHTIDGIAGHNRAPHTRSVKQVTKPKGETQWYSG